MRADSTGRNGVWLAATVACGLALTFAVPGCSDDPVRPAPTEPEPRREVWIGAYDGYKGETPQKGPLVLDLVVTGSTARAGLTLREGASASAIQLEGTADDNGFVLGPDPSLKGTWGETPGLSGELSSFSRLLTADFQCDRVPVGSLTEKSSVQVSGAVTGLASVAGTLWMSTATQDYLRLDADGAFLDPVTVLYLGYHWTSDVLASDGTHLWGHLPGTVSTGSGTYNTSRILEFTPSGNIIGEFVVDSRSRGLAWDGSSLWTLADGDRLLRLDMAGGSMGSAEVKLIALVGLAYSGDHFWTLGYYEHLLYELDQRGNVVRVYDLPGGKDYPEGLTFAGDDLWYSRATITGMNVQSEVSRFAVDSGSN